MFPGFGSHYTEGSEFLSHPFIGSIQKQADCLMSVLQRYELDYKATEVFPSQL